MATPNQTAPAPDKDERLTVAYRAFGSDAEVKLSPSIIRRFLCKPTKKGVLPSDAEVMNYMMMCQARALNPFERDCFLVGYDGQDGAEFSIIVAIQTFLKRAEASNDFDGIESGVIVLDKEGQPIEREGDFHLPGEQIVGGWARVWRKNIRLPFKARLRSSVYSKNNKFWNDNPGGMIAKCFDQNTEVLTTRGFERFATAEGRVLQVSENGLEPTDAVPFFQAYTGPMVQWNSRNGNFLVTPNHDMPISLNGHPEKKIEAGELLRLRQRDRAIMPLTIKGSAKDSPITDSTIKLAAAYIADGSDNSKSSGFCISVSRDDKIWFLRDLAAHTSAAERDDAGREGTLPSGRVITTRKNKTAFYYSRSPELTSLVGRKKAINNDTILSLSMRQARLLLETWMDFDGHRQASMKCGRIYTSRREHVKALEILAVVAGYSISAPTARENDGCDTNYVVSITDRTEVRLQKSLLSEVANPGNGVWCVTVPTGKIVVRRQGFSSVCHQCAEADALRTAFPTKLGGLYIEPETRGERDVTPAAQRPTNLPGAERPGFLGDGSANVPMTMPATRTQEPERQTVTRTEPEPEQQQREPLQQEAAPDDSAERDELLRRITEAREADGIPVKNVRTWAHRNNLCSSAQLALPSYDTASLRALLDRWNEVRGGDQPEGGQA